MSLATYTRSIRIMGDIYRKKMEVEKAFNQYEQSMAAAQRLGDRLAQMESMDGIARCLEILRWAGKYHGAKTDKKLIVFQQAPTKDLQLPTIGAQQEIIGGCKFHQL